MIVFFFVIHQEIGAVGQTDYMVPATRFYFDDNNSFTIK